MTETSPQGGKNEDCKQMYYIREANVNDVETISCIAQQTWWPTYTGILSLEQSNFMLANIYSADVIIKQIKTAEQTYILLFEADVTVAFAAYSPRAEDGSIYKLHKLYCLPLTQGKGYGKILINEICHRAIQAGGHTLDLNVNRHNTAKSFYNKMGFEVAYEEDIPIGPYWMNDYVMRKNLR